MITPLDVSGQALARLGHMIADDLTNLGVVFGGLEVLRVQDEGDVFKAYYVFERDYKDVHQSVYFQSSYEGGEFHFYHPVVFGAE